MVHDDFGREGEDCGAVVEVVAKEHEPILNYQHESRLLSVKPQICLPFVTRDRTPGANDQRSGCSLWVIVLSTNTLRAQISKEVDDQTANKLRRIWPIALTAAIGLEPFRERAESLPQRHRSDGVGNWY